MSLHQTDFAYGRKQQPTDYAFGTTCTAILTYNFPKAFTAASDVLELGMIPGTAQIVGATLIGEGLGDITVDIGTMDGEAGEADDSRALTADLIFDGVSVNDNEADATRLTCLGFPRAADHRGLGATFSGNVAKDAGTLTVVLEYIF